MSYLAFTEIRTVKADEIPFSPALGTDVVGINMVWNSKYMGMVWVYMGIFEKHFANDKAISHFRTHLSGLFLFEKGLFSSIYAKEIERLDALINEHSISRPNQFENCYTERLLFGKSEC